jgi:hypothetical protein
MLSYPLAFKGSMNFLVVTYSTIALAGVAKIAIPNAFGAPTSNGSPLSSLLAAESRAFGLFFCCNLLKKNNTLKIAIRLTNRQPITTPIVSPVFHDFFRDAIFVLVEVGTQPRGAVA